MTDFIDGESRGDHSNFKGNQYHLVYVLWRLLQNPSDTIAFYEGNDLVAHPVAPPDPLNVMDQPVWSHADDGVSDVWCQLKNTKSAWTVSVVLSENLLFNFIGNSFTSDARNREWQIELVTSAEVRGTELAKFAERFATDAPVPKHGPKWISEFQKLNAIIDKSVSAIGNSEIGLSPDRSAVSDRAVEIIRQIAECETLPYRTMMAEVKSGLMRAVGDFKICEEVQHRVVGALLEDATKGPAAARSYDSDWLKELTGFNFKEQKPLDESAKQGCNAQVASSVSQAPVAFDSGLYSPRTWINEALAEFLKSDKTCLLITGRSGAGKSWSLYESCTKALNDRARLLIDGRFWRAEQSLEECLAGLLSPFTSQVGQADRVLANKILQPARASDFGPLVLVIDDVQPSSDGISTFRRNVERFVLQCRTANVRVILTCQTERVGSLAPFANIRSDLAFQPSKNKKASSSASGPDTFELSDFIDSEMAEAIAKRVGGEDSERLTLAFRSAVYAPLRNPYILDAMCRDGVVSDSLQAPIEVQRALDELFDRRVTGIVDRIVLNCRLDNASAALVFESVLSGLWSHRRSGCTRPQLEQEIESALPGSGHRITESLIEDGVLSVGQCLSMNEPQLAARATAGWLSKTMSVQTVINELNASVDAEILTEWLRLQDCPAEIASSLPGSNAESRAAIAYALSRCECDDAVIASLIGLARNDEHFSVQLEVCGALGELGIRNDDAWKWLIRLFISPDDGDRRIAESAFWHVAKFVPDKVAAAVRLRLKQHWQFGLTGNKEEKYRKKTAKSIRPLKSIDSRYAGEEVLRTISVVAPIAVPGRPGDSDDRAFRKHLLDHLIEEYDELRAVACYYADRSQFDEICEELRSDSEVARLRSANGLAALSRDAADVVGPMLADAISRESSPPIAARMIWHLVGFAEISAQEAVEAVASCPAHSWSSYEVTGAVLSLYEWIAWKHPRTRFEAVPPTLLPELKEGKYWISEVQLALLQRLIAARTIDQDAATQFLRLLECSEGSGPVVHMLTRRSRALCRLFEAARSADLTTFPTIHRVELRVMSCFVLDVDSWYEEYADEISPHLDHEALLAELVASVSSHGEFNPDFDEDWEKQSAFMMTRDALDVIAVIVGDNIDRLAFLDDVPHDWEMLYLLTRLLERGVHHEQVISVAQAECDSHQNSATAQASADRSDCLIQLRRARGESANSSAVAIEHSGLSWWFGGGRSGTDQLSSAMDDRPDLILAILDESIQKPTHGLVALDWVHTARSWQAVTISYLFARCADPRPLLRAEVKQLVHATLVAIESLVESPQRDEWHSVFREILTRCADSTAAPDCSVACSTALLGQSHELALAILARPTDEPQLNADFVSDRRGWWESENHRREPDGCIQHGFGLSYHLCGYFPSVRLALAAVSLDSDLIDPAAIWMRDRTRSVLLAKELHHSRKSLDKKVKELVDAIREMPQQDELHLCLGNLLVTNGQYEQGAKYLTTVLSMPHADDDAKASAYYDLACVHAKRNDESSCRDALLRSSELRKLNTEWARKDEDLAAYWEIEWFKELLASIDDA